MRSLARVLLLGAAIAVATYVLGWWSVPVLAATWGLVSWRMPNAAGTAALAACVAWGALLGLTSLTAPAGALAHRLGGVMGVPAIALIAVTLLFPTLLAWSAAAVGQVVRRGMGVRR